MGNKNRTKKNAPVVLESELSPASIEVIDVADFAASIVDSAIASIEAGAEVSDAAAIEDSAIASIEAGAEVSDAAAIEDSAIASIEAGAEVSDAAAIEVSAPVSAPRFVVIGKRDALGFGESTETSYLLGAIRTGEYTRPALLSAFLSRFVPNSDASEIKRKKTSFSVFFSDVKRPIGTYHASRGIGIRVSESGLLSFDPSEYDRAVAAIAGGILGELKGLSPKRTPEKYAKVLSKFGLSAETVKE